MNAEELLAERYELVSSVRELRNSLSGKPSKQKHAIRNEVHSLQESIAAIEKALAGLDCRQAVISVMSARGCTHRTINDFLRKIKKTEMTVKEKDHFTPKWRESELRKQRESDRKAALAKEMAEKKRLNQQWRQAVNVVKARARQNTGRGRIGDGNTPFRGRPMQGGGCSPK